MKFSVLLSVYAKESPENLNSALKSIWSEQTYKPSEIVLVKDGQLTKALEDIIDYWLNNSPLLVIALPTNTGLGNALNVGLNYCSYEWIFRMDTDDISVPDRFEKQIQFIQNTPSLDICGGQVREFINNLNDLKKYRRVPLTHKDILKFCKIRSPFNHPTVAYKKSAVLALGGYHNHYLMEDYNLWIRALSAGLNAQNLSHTLVLMRVDGLPSRRSGSKYIQSEWKLLQLKNSVGLSSKCNNLLMFFVRSIPRILPKKALKIIYEQLCRCRQSN